MKIKKAAELVGLETKTIRYYEEVGMIPPITRLDNGIRDFNKHDILWIQYAKALRSFGISVSTIASYVSLFEAGRFNNRPEGKDILQKQIDKIANDIESLNQKHQELVQIVNEWDIVIPPLIEKNQKEDN